MFLGKQMKIKRVMKTLWKCFHNERVILCKGKMWRWLDSFLYNGKTKVSRHIINKEGIWFEKKPPRKYSIIFLSLIIHFLSNYLDWISHKIFTNEFLTNKLVTNKQTNKVMSKLHFCQQSWKWLIGLWGRSSHKMHLRLLPP